MKIPSRILEAICNDELQAQDFYDVYGKENVINACNQIKLSNEQIKQTYSAEDMKRAVAQKLQYAKNNKTSRKYEKFEKIELKQQNFVVFGEKNTEKSQKTSFSKFKVIIPTMAAAVIVAVLLPRMILSNNLQNSQNLSEISTKSANIRVKGAKNITNLENSRQNQKSEIRLYKKTDDGVQLLANGDSAKSGDIIQITYAPGKNNYGVIFSVDGNGNITRHFPEKSWKSERLSHEKPEIPLDFSYELDNDEIKIYTEDVYEYLKILGITGDIENNIVRKRIHEIFNDKDDEYRFLLLKGNKLISSTFDIIEEN